MSYDNWRKRLDIAEKYSTVALRRERVAALKINFSQPQPEDEGYYRKPITVKQPNGQSRVVGWMPVAYFLSDATSAYGVELCGLIGMPIIGADNPGFGMRNMTDAEVKDEELWSWVVSNPISYEEYERVADNGGAWSDMPVIDPNRGTTYGDIPERVIERTDNLPPTVDPLTEHKEGIANATKAALATYKEITSNDLAAQAEGAKNRIAELRLKADKAGKAEYQPPYTEYKRLHGLWTPMVKDAEDAEKTLGRRVLLWRESERKRLIADQAAIARDRAMAEEVASRAADRAIAAGIPPAEQTPPPLIEPTTTPAPAPPKPTYGTRSVKAEMKIFVEEITDWTALCNHYKDSQELRNLLIRFAEGDLKAGFMVPGVTTRKGFV